MRGRKITEEEYAQVKKHLRYHGVPEVARRNQLSKEKVMKIQVSNSYGHFEDITRAEHPPQGESTLGIRVRKIEAELEDLKRLVLPLG